VTNETGSTRDSTHKVRVGSHFSLTNPDGVSLVTDRVLRIGESIRLSASGVNSNEYGTISFYANDELIPNCSFDTQVLPWRRFGCEWIPEEGDYTITVVGVEAEGKERFISPKTQRISVIPMGAVGLGEALPVDEDGVPILVTDFEDLSCLGCDESVITRPSRILHWPKIPVGAGGRISLVEFVELEDESEAFDAIKFRDHKLPILYDAMPNSFVTLDRFVFDPNLAAGDYSATYQLVFDDGTVIRTKLNASINSESSDLVPEPTGLTSFLIVLLIMLVYRQSPATCHSGQTSYYSHESRATRTH
jgi:hypothetical protein